MAGFEVTLEAQRVVGQAKSVARQSALAIPLSSGKPRRQLRQLNRMIPLGSR